MTPRTLAAQAAGNVAKFFTQKDGVIAGAMFSGSIVTGDKPLVIANMIMSGTDSPQKFFIEEDATATLGSQREPEPMDRQNPVNFDSVFKEGVTPDSPADPVNAFFVLSALINQQTDEELVLKPNSNYIVTLLNDATGQNDMSFSAVIWEDLK